MKQPRRSTIILTAGLLIGGLLSAWLLVSTLLTVSTPRPVLGAEALVIPTEPAPPPSGGGGGGGSPFVAAANIPSPNVSVQPGARASFTIPVRNVGSSRARNVTVTMPYDPAKLAILDVQFTRTSAVIVENSPGRLVFETGEISSRAVMTATVQVSVSSAAAPGSLLIGRLEVRGSGVGSETQISNQPILVVGGGNVNIPVYSMAVSPVNGPAGSTHVFTSDVFHPYEPITLWLNTPANNDIEVIVAQADANGLVTLGLTTTGLPSGRYAMVGNGNWSFIQATVNFVVE